MKAAITGGRRAVPLLNHILEFAFQLRENTENLSQFRRVMSDTTPYVDIGALFWGSIDWSADHQFSSVNLG
jgi:hypothetical protein